MRVPMTFRLTAVAGAAALALTACSSNEHDDQSLETAPSAAPAAAMPAPQDQPEVLSEITKKRIRYYDGPDGDPKQNWADFYLPAGPQKVDSIPLVVLIHGGAWKVPGSAEGFNRLSMDIAGLGAAVYNVEYRRVGAGGGWPDTFHDVARALDYVPTLDKDYPQITTDDEVVVGHSAGAQLAAWAGTRHKLADDEVGSKPAFRPTRVVSLAGPLDMRVAVADGDDRIVTALGGEPDEVPERYAKVDPIQNLDPEMPVAAVHGTRDKVVFPHNSENYIAALTDAGGSGDLMILDGHSHGSFLEPDNEKYRQILDLIRKYSDTPADELGED